MLDQSVHSDKYLPGQLCAAQCGGRGGHLKPALRKLEFVWSCEGLSSAFYPSLMERGDEKYQETVEGEATTGLSLALLLGILRFSDDNLLLV